MTMNIGRWAGRMLVAVLVAFTVLAGAWGLPRVGLGQGEAPGASTDPLKVAPFDRLSLVDGKQLLVEPVSPRPLPPILTAQEKEKRQRERARKEKAASKKAARKGRPAEAKKEAAPEEET